MPGNYKKVAAVKFERNKYPYSDEYGHKPGSEMGIFIISKISRASAFFMV
jgi:hypothetical protein